MAENNPNADYIAIARHAKHSGIVDVGLDCGVVLLLAMVNKGKHECSKKS
jgi:hypothetical protein